MLRGAKVYNSKHSIWWSSTLHHAYLQAKYWKLKRVQNVTKVLMLHKLTSILKQLPPTSPLHAQHAKTYKWKYKRKEKKCLHQARQLDSAHCQQFLDEQTRKLYHHQNLNKPAKLKGSVMQKFNHIFTEKFVLF